MDLSNAASRSQVSPSSASAINCCFGPYFVSGFGLWASLAWRVVSIRHSIHIRDEGRVASLVEIRKRCNLRVNHNHPTGGRSRQSRRPHHPTSSPKRNARPFPGRFRSGGRSPRAGNAPERAVWWRIPSPGHPIRRPGRRKSRGSERNPALPAPQGPSAGQARPPGRREGGARPSPRGPRLVACLFPADRRNGRLREAGPAAAPPPV